MLFPDGLQRLVPGLQTTQSPLRHTWDPPQFLPLVALPLALQTEVPVSQDVFPTLQGSSGVQLELAVHGVQLPRLQTMLLPQEAPSFSEPPVSLHSATPLAHDSAPL
jgi:hypothetical protein